MNKLADAEFQTGGTDVLIKGDRSLLGAFALTEEDKRARGKEMLFTESGRSTIEGVEILNALFRRGVRARVSDMHFKQEENGGCVRFRMPGGALETIGEFDAETMRILDDKLRSKAQLSTTDRRSPQDNRMSLMVDGMRVDVRVALSPGVPPTQLIVCRLQLPGAQKSLADIDMSPPVREALMRVVSEPTGLFIISGPTGSGKTTTLYGILDVLNEAANNIMTAENPVEVRVKEFHQINVDGRDMTFAGALRAMLRQDPDVIMVGEIRDAETAQIAVQAALTGHLVLSTVHANDSAMAVTRLVDLGVDPHLLAACLRGVTAQRLVRRISPDADVERLPPTSAEQTWLKAYNIHRQEPTYPKFVGDSPAYEGVIPVMEVIMMDHRVKKVIDKGAAAIFAAASRQAQFETIGQAAERLAIAGKTTLDEARRLASVQEAPQIHNKRVGQLLVERGVVAVAEMEEAVNAQCALRQEGQHKKLGALLVERELCTMKQVIDAVGYTAEAEDVLRKFCQNEERRQQLAALLRKWAVGTESLFDLAVEAQLITKEEIYDDTNIS